MDKSNKFLIFLVILLAVLFSTSLFLYFKQKESKPVVQTEPTNTAPPLPTGPQKGELEYNEPQTTIEIGTEGVTRGTFEKVEGDSIFLKTDADTVTQLSLTTDEIAIQCTDQDLSTANELDFNLVTKVDVATPLTLGSKLPANEQLVVFAQQVEGTNRVHTVALSSAKCSI